MFVSTRLLGCLLSHVLNGRDFAFVFTKIISNWSDMSVDLSLTGDYWLRFITKFAFLVLLIDIICIYFSVFF